MTDMKNKRADMLTSVRTIIQSLNHNFEVSVT